jgi:hypothetical protein
LESVRISSTWALAAGSARISSSQLRLANGRFGDQTADDRRIPEVGRGVVRVGNVGNGGLMLAHGGQHGGFVELKIGGQRYTMKREPLKLRAHGVHDEAGQRGKNRRARHIAGHGQQRNQLIGAVAQHQTKAFRQIDMAGQRGFQVLDPATRIAVDGDRAQSLTQRMLHVWGQGKRVLHRVQLDQPRRVLDGVGVHGLDVLADETHGFRRSGVAHEGSRIGGTLFNRISAARAWA